MCATLIAQIRLESIQALCERTHGVGSLLSRHIEGMGQLSELTLTLPQAGSVDQMFLTEPVEPQVFQSVKLGNPCSYLRLSRELSKQVMHMKTGKHLCLLIGPHFLWALVGFAINIPYSLWTSGVLRDSVQLHPCYLEAQEEGPAELKELRASIGNRTRP